LKRDEFVIQSERIKAFNGKSVNSSKSYVLYWMQAAQRAHFNHALELAIQKANDLEKPLVVVFGLTDEYPQANLRHYYFMLEGLRETEQQLRRRNIRMVIRYNRPDQAAIELSKNACIVITDSGHLKIQKEWRLKASRQINCLMLQVETNLIVPIEEVSGKEEFAARTIRPKIIKQFQKYLIKIQHKKLKAGSLGLKFDSFNISDIDKASAKLNIDRSVGKTTFIGGTSQAQKLLRHFIKYKLDKYENLRNDPNLDYQSNMSPYLHFGQISPLYIALEIKKAKSAGSTAYLEELIVRRELSHNFIYYNNNYDSFEGLEHWSKRILNYHSKDKREYIYTPAEFEQAKTHDAYWNAAQKEMIITGKMHGYMRMYWGKKILEWSKNPKQAFKTAIYLNDKYELDGRDPNGFTGVSWCFGKHDRPWARRGVFGTIRYMNASGLMRKFDADKYVKKIEMLEKNYNLLK